MPTNAPLAPAHGANFDAAAQIVRSLVVDKVPARTLAARLGVSEAQLATHAIIALQEWTAAAAVATAGWADLSATIDGLTEVLETRQA